mgnify:CR=1 FL=1
MENTFVMLKPDAVQRQLVGEIITRFEKKGFEIVAMRVDLLPQEAAEVLYEEHEGSQFFDSLTKFTASGPVVLMVLRGLDAIRTARKMLGDRRGVSAIPGTIRGDYSMSKTERNLVHASVDTEAAEREISLFFSDVLDENRAISYDWKYSESDRRFEKFGALKRTK